MDVMRHRSSQGRKRRTGIRSWMLLLAVCSGLANACAQSSPSATTDRPERYSPYWGQYILDTYTNPRQLSVFRLGESTGDYVRCPAEEWRNPPEIWTKVQKREQEKAK